MGRGISQGEGVVYISRSKLLEVLQEEGGLLLPENCSLVVGAPIINDEGEMELHFAWDSADSHPSEWAKPPRFMEKSRE